MTAWVLKFNHRTPDHYFAGTRRDPNNNNQPYEALTTNIAEAVHYHSESDAIMNRDALVNGAQNYTPLEVQN